MKKLKLNLEEIKVESFEITPNVIGKGTIKGNCVGWGLNSNGGSCNSGGLNCEGGGVGSESCDYAIACGGGGGIGTLSPSCQTLCGTCYDTCGNNTCWAGVGNCGTQAATCATCNGPTCGNTFCDCTKNKFDTICVASNAICPV